MLLFCSCSEVSVRYEATTGGQIIGESEQSVKKSDGVAVFASVTAEAQDGYRFISWDDGETNPTRQDLLSEDGKITALFEPIPRATVTYSSIGGGRVSGVLTQTVEIGEYTSQVVAIANDGFRFDYWSDGLTTPTRSDEVSGDKSYSAIFTPYNIITVNYDADVGGTILGNTVQNAEKGVSLETVHAIPDKGYRFLQWSDGSTNQSRTDIADDNAIYIAYFQRVYTVTYSCNTLSGSIQGVLNQQVDVGKSTQTVTAVETQFGYKFVCWSNGETSKSITITPSEDTELVAIFAEVDYVLPSIHIDTGGRAITSKDTYISCTVSTDNTRNIHTFSNLSAKIRGRGNTSWTECPKKSYRIKLDEKQSLFGNGAAKDWTLIANYCDKSLIRNYLAYSVGIEFSKLQETTTTQLIEVYLNNEYLGVYLLCEQIEAGGARVDIDESLSYVDTGYLLEIDGRADGTYFTAYGQNYLIKSPDVDSALFTDEHKQFIQSYVNQCLDTMTNGSYEDVCELVDVESFAQAYIVFELFKCVDVGGLSFYMHKEAGGKMYCGPIWDFDRSMGNINYNANAINPEYLWARSQNVWFNRLFRHEEFYNLVCELLKEYKPVIENTLDKCYNYVYTVCPDAFDRNFERWKLLEVNVNPNPAELNAIKTWQGQVEYTREFIEKSLAYMLTQYPSESS